MYINITIILTTHIIFLLFWVIKTRSLCFWKNSWNMQVNKTNKSQTKQKSLVYWHSLFQVSKLQDFKNLLETNWQKIKYVDLPIHIAVRKFIKSIKPNTVTKLSRSKCVFHRFNLKPIAKSDTDRRIQSRMFV